MRTRIVSVSAVAYDGYEIPDMLESLASCGVRYVEPAFIAGYSDSFDEAAFSTEKARQYGAWLRESGVCCHALSAHMDLGQPESVAVFERRMDFAARIGAKVINTTSAARESAARFFENIKVLARHAEELGITIGLENHGDGSDNLLNTAADGIALLETIGHDRIRLNYDAGNAVSHRPAGRPGGVDPVADALLAMPYCIHSHIKDVRVTDDGYFFQPLGRGDVGCAAILRAVAATGTDVSIEMPLRGHRSRGGQMLRTVQGIVAVCGTSPR
jgi:sugar phosphate isomerase/epimerase